MNQIEAMRQTVRLMETRLAYPSYARDRAIANLDPSLQPGHVQSMLWQMESNTNPQGGGFDEAKLGRWLGWAQAAVVAMGLATLDEFKEINKNA